MNRRGLLQVPVLGEPPFLMPPYLGVGFHVEAMHPLKEIHQVLVCVLLLALAVFLDALRHSPIEGRGT